jgi:hypothetical protein
MEWISVEDRKPEEGIRVLVYVGMPVAPSGEIDVGYFDDGEWITRYHTQNVTHWMPLPDEPKEG